MIAFTRTFALVSILLPYQVAAVCKNSDTFKFFIDGKERTCKNIRINEDRRVEACKDPTVNVACPQACGKCCEDDPDYYFNRRAPNVPSGTCDWLSQKQKRIDRFCPDLTSNNGTSVRDACPVTCSFCFLDSEVTVPPSASPTKKATPAPTAPKGTPAPTTSFAPSKAPTTKPSPTPTQQPTRPPSPMPSPFPTLRPTSVPSDSPSEKPSVDPSVSPSEIPSDDPSSAPSSIPSDAPSKLPSTEPSVSPSEIPSDDPSTAPSEIPSDKPSRTPSDEPSLEPSGFPSDRPTKNPSSEPSITPTGNPTRSIKPSPSPSAAPTRTKTKAPTKAPVKPPTKAPTKAPVTCSDNGAFTWILPNTGNTASCAWLTTNASREQERKDTWCACPGTGPLGACPIANLNVNSECCATCAGY